MKTKHIVTYNKKADELRVENVATMADDGDTQRINELVFCNYSQLTEQAVLEAIAKPLVIQAQIPIRLAGDAYLKKNRVIRRSALKPGAKISSPETLRREAVIAASQMTATEAREVAEYYLQQAELSEAVAKKAKA